MVIDLPTDDAIAVPRATLDRLMPLYVQISAQGIIVHLGPTLRHVVGPGIEGQPFFSCFRVARPMGINSLGDLMSFQGEKLRVQLRFRSRAEFRGQALSDGQGGVILNMSFGINVADAIRTHGLTVADFAPTDLAIEMLYLVEAKTAIVEELRRLNSRLEGARSEAAELALTDTLTGLRNRRAFDLALAAIAASDMPFALMHLDLDGFKAVNDSLGHAAGDAVLCEVAQRLHSQTRSADTVARIGGDEFVILLPGMVRRADLLSLGERVIADLRRPIGYDGQHCQIGTSIGVVLSALDGLRDPAELLQQADAALYSAKRAGKGQLKFADSQIDVGDPDARPARPEKPLKNRLAG